MSVVELDNAAARSAALDAFRRGETSGMRALYGEYGRSMVSLPPDAETLEAVWQVRQAINELPAEEATIVRMQHLDGMTQLAISERLGIPLGTVKTKSRRAHQHLALLLGHLRSS
jgi:RNA polymerase sigma factor (sigma-70 family)